MSAPVVGRTKSTMSILWVAAETVPDGLRRLADELERRDLDEAVIALGLTYVGPEDQYQYQVDATIEETR